MSPAQVVLFFHLKRFKAPLGKCLFRTAVGFQSNTVVQQAMWGRAVISSSWGRYSCIVFQGWLVGTTTVYLLDQNGLEMRLNIMLRYSKSVSGSQVSQRFCSSPLRQGGKILPILFHVINSSLLLHDFDRKVQTYGNSFMGQLQSVVHQLDTRWILAAFCKALGGICYTCE